MFYVLSVVELDEKVFVVASTEKKEIAYAVVFEQHYNASVCSGRHVELRRLININADRREKHL
jgi:hypothetical protein